MSIYVSSDSIAGAAARDDIEAVRFSRQTDPLDRNPLLDHPGIRTIDAGIERLPDPTQVNSFPSLEYLSMTASDWRILLNASAVPESLLSTKVNSLDALDVVTVSNQLLALWGRPLITVTTLRGDVATAHPPLVAAAPLTTTPEIGIHSSILLTKVR